MTESVQHAVVAEQEGRQPAARPDETAWQTPGYAVVDTALEVTAYSLSSR